RSFNSPLHRADIKKVALKDLRARRAQAFRAFVDLVHEGAHGNAARQEHFGNMPAGLALPATGRGRNENGSCHGYTSQISLWFLRTSVWYYSVPSAVRYGTCWYQVNGRQWSQKGHRGGFRRQTKEKCALAFWKRRFRLSWSGALPRPQPWKSQRARGHPSVNSMRCSATSRTCWWPAFASEPSG